MLTNLVKEKDGFRLFIENDEMAQNPREEFDNFGKIAYWHKRYILGDEAPDCDPEEFIESLPKGSVILSLYLYDHSGITISTSPFSCPWDSGQVGYIYATPEMIRKEYGKLTKETKAKAERLLKCEIETFDQYLTGDVWWYAIEAPDGEMIESCGGFYGYKDCEEEALSLFRRIVNDEKRESKYAASLC